MPQEGCGPSDGQPATLRDPTGDERVDAALSRLDAVSSVPVSEHPAIFDEVHRDLAAILGELDSDAPGR